MTLLVQVQNPYDFTALPSEQHFTHWARAAWLDESDAGVVIRIVNEEDSQQLNLQFRGKDYPTNVLSFPYEPDFDLQDVQEEDELEIDYLGDMVLCKAVVEREAKEQGKVLEQHWAHLVVHGLLHLQGYDHINETERELMELRELDILRDLNIPNPYLID
ncbi:rRNA maturation RNase YbeY [Thiolinea disciformis]|uniref:rRNA maturation RNase YbeY n=1 Tax=Thiolinea disciformis TaxID=125614 RepID=UPI000363F94D|nr:rRNA maturation RNase YbeY [Thiolinea disciformis]